MKDLGLMSSLAARKRFRPSRWLLCASGPLAANKMPPY